LRRKNAPRPVEERSALVCDVPLAESAFPKSKLPGNSISAQSAQPGAAWYQCICFRITVKAARRVVFHRTTDLALGRARGWNGGKADLETPGQNVLKIAHVMARHWKTLRQREKRFSP